MITDSPQMRIRGRLLEAERKAVPGTSGQLRGLAVTSAKRLDLFPDLPPVSDFVPGYEAFAWQGLMAPKDTSPEILGRLNKELNAALADATIKKRLEDLGGVPMPMTPAECRARNTGSIEFNFDVG